MSPEPDEVHTAYVTVLPELDGFADAMSRLFADAPCLDEGGVRPLCARTSDPDDIRTAAAVSFARAVFPGIAWDDLHPFARALALQVAPAVVEDLRAFARSVDEFFAALKSEQRAAARRALCPIEWPGQYEAVDTHPSRDRDAWIRINHAWKASISKATSPEGR